MSRGMGLETFDTKQLDCVHAMHCVMKLFNCRLFNMGGPERLSRFRMAELVAETWEHSKAAIQVPFF